MHRMASAQAYNSGLGAEPPAGSGAEPLIRRSGGFQGGKAHLILLLLSGLRYSFIATCCDK